MEGQKLFYIGFVALMACLFIPCPGDSQSYDWYMVDTSIFQRPCSLIAVCLYFRVKLLETIIELKDEPGRFDGYDLSKEKRRLVMWKKNIEAFAKATVPQTYDQTYHLLNNRRECSTARILSCEYEFHQEMYKHCLITQKNQKVKDEAKCLSEPDPLRWDLYSMMVVYFGTGKLVSLDGAYKYVAQFYPDIYIYGSHGYLLRLQNRTHKEWLKYEKATLTNFTITSMCNSQVHAICVYRKKAPGDVECYDNHLTNVPCWGQITKPRGLRPNLKYGRGRMRITSAEVAPYLVPPRSSNFD